MSELEMPIPSAFDFHKAITKKERSSRYIRTAFDYLARVKGEAALDAFLEDVGIPRTSSIFKHIYDDENWNSYALEVFLYDKLKDLFDDPYKAIYEFGVASGSGHLDQKDTLFAFKLKIAPFPVIVRKLAEFTSRVTLISDTRAEFIDEQPSLISTKGAKVGRIYFRYNRLPEGFEYPSWTSKFMPLRYRIVAYVIAKPETLNGCLNRFSAQLLN
ncbi:MAG: hypothetical protein JNM27_09705 [Leptospirales bacterium]|nr:hypothetical protein [Leptospirales bacterium]